MSKKIPAQNEDGGEIVSMVMMGALMGFLLTGIFLGTIGFLIDCMSGEWAWRWTNLLGGVVCIGLGAVVALLLFLYIYFFLPHNMAKVFPRLWGFGFIPALLALFSAMITGIQISSWVVPKWLGV